MGVETGAGIGVGLESGGGGGAVWANLGGKGRGKVRLGEGFGGMCRDGLGEWGGAEWSGPWTCADTTTGGEVRMRCVPPIIPSHPIPPHLTPPKPSPH